MNSKKRRTDESSSRTAAFTCMCRASSNMERNEFYHSDDTIAPRLLPHSVKFLLRCKLINLKWPIFAKGIYEYVIARTRYMDELVKDAIEDGIDQIFIFGAGFDSRANRFESISRNTNFFELDTYHTQSAKLDQFKKRNIPLPKKTVYIPIDFNRESVPKKIQRKGFDPQKKTLFLMEGLIMYLEPEAVCDLFNTVHSLSSPGSGVVFDYIHASVLRKEHRYYGEKSIFDTVGSVKESWQFGIEDGEVGSFVEASGFILLENLDWKDLEKRYFTDGSKNRVARVNGTHGIAHVKK